MNTKLLLWMLVLVLIISSVKATTYYADPVLGDDSAVGDVSNPWQTIGCHMSSSYTCPNGDATKNLAHYDTLILKDGLYNESVNVLGGVWVGLAITIEGENKGGATVQCPGAISTYVFYTGSGVTFKNFNINAQGRTYCAKFLTKGTNATVDGINCYNSSGGISRQWSSFDGTGFYLRNSFINTTNSQSITNDAIDIEKEVNVVVENNTIIARDDLEQYVDRYFFYAYEGDYTGPAETIVRDNDMYGTSYVTQDDDLILYNNTFNGNTGFKSYNIYKKVEENNTFNWQLNGASFTNVNFIDRGVFENREINFQNYSKSFLYFYNVSNVLVNNLTCGSLASPCYSNTVDTYSPIVFSGSYSTDSFNENCVVTNNTVFLNKGGAGIHTLYMKDSEISNNYVWINRTAQGIMVTYPIRTNITNNVIDAITQDPGYALGIGGEGQAMYPNGTWVSRDNRVIGNTITGPLVNDALGAMHTVLFGGQTGSLLENNTVNGGMYSYVIKSINNSRVIGNYGNGSISYGFLFKGAQNMYVENNIGIGGETTTIYPLVIHDSDTANMVYSTNMTIINFTSTRWNFNILQALVRVYGNSTVKAFDLDYGGVDSRVGVTYDATDTSYLELYYDDGTGLDYVKFLQEPWRITADSYINETKDFSNGNLLIKDASVLTEYDLTNTGNITVQGGTFTVKGAIVG